MKRVIFCILCLVFPLRANAGDEHGHGHGHGHDEHEGHDENFLELSWDKARSAGVSFQDAGPAKIGRPVVLNGEVALNGDQVVHVVPRFPGILRKVEKQLGDEVKAGELLAVVQSNESLQNYEIRADVAGTVIEKDATLGEFVRDDKQLFTIANLEAVWVNAAVFPEDLETLSVSTPVVITSRASQLTYKGEISYIRPILSELTRTALARVVVPNPERRWRPGMFVTVTASLAPADIPVAVPPDAVVLLNNQQTVFLKRKNNHGEEGFEIRKVTVGRSDLLGIEIVAGLKSGETVATGNTFILKAEQGKGSAAHEH